MNPVVPLKLAMMGYVNYTRVKEVTQPEVEGKSHLGDPGEGVGVNMCSESIGTTEASRGSALRNCAG